MTQSVLGNLDEITPDWITRLFDRSGDLRGNQVSDVTVEWRGFSNNGALARLRLDWSPAAPPDAPSRLFVKMRKAAGDPEPHHPGPVGRGEVSFYRNIYPLKADLPIVHCYEAARDEESGRFHLIFEDLSETHQILPDAPLPPTDEQCGRIVDSLARIHAAWWDDPRLATSIGILPGVEGPVTWFAEAFPGFCDRLGDRLSRQRRACYERILTMGPRLSQRYRAGKNLTLIHGDTHVWNLLYPKDGSGTIRWIDWSACSAPRTGALDLGYMMALFWYPERRRRLEADLKARYYETLTANGVQGYGLDALRYDYRLAVIHLAGLPVLEAAAGVSIGYCWSEMERIMSAVEDLGCEELLS